MKPVFMLLPPALGLLACTQADMTAESNGCKPVALADRPITWQLATPGVRSTGPLMIPGKAGSHSRTCIRHEDNRSNPREIHDLQKIG